MDPAFHRAAKTPHATPIILGLRLQPFTLGHLFLLLERESPFVTEGKPFDWPDLFAAVFLCTNSEPGTRNPERAWWLPLFFRIWSLFVRLSSLPKELDAFTAWLASEQAAPILSRPIEETNRGCNAPSPFVKLMFAMHILHCSRAEAMALRLSELNCLYASWADWSGRGELTHNPRYEATWEFAKAQDALRFNADGSRKDRN